MSVTDISRGDFAAAMEKLTGKWFHTAAQADYDSDYKKIFKVVNMDGAYMDDQLHSHTGLLQAIPEGMPTPYSKMSQGFSKRYTAMDYRDAISITQNMIDDQRAFNILKEKSFALGRAAEHTKDVLCMQVLNRAFSSAYAGGDGVELCSTAHPTKSGNMSNELQTPADLSESSLEQVDLELADVKAEDGLRLGLKPVKLIIPRASKFDAQRILRSDLRVGTSDNDVNAQKSLGMYSGGIVVSDRLTDSNAFFVLTNQDAHGLTLAMRKAPTMSADKDFETDSAKFKVHMRMDVGWTDWRHVFGSPGSS